MPEQEDQMKKQILILLAVCFGLFATGLYGMDMKQRLAIIKGLKNKGLVGESNQGLLAFVTEKKVAEEVINQENAERLKTYQKIAKEQDVAPEDVGRQHAVQIAKEAKPGEMIQNEEGKWTRKK